MTYLENYFKLEINNKKIFEVKNNFPKGRFGFYCFSQDMIYFSNIEIKNGEHLLKPSLEDLEEPIEIKGYIDKTDNNLFDIISANYQIKNNSEYDIEDLYISLYIDPELKLLIDSINIKQSTYDLKYNKANNEYKLSGITLDSQESIYLNYFLEKRNPIVKKEQYLNKILVKSSKKDILLSNSIKSEIEFNDVNNILNAEIVGRVNIDKNASSLNLKEEDIKFKIVTSDGRLIQVDKNGKYHLTVNKFNGLFEKETIVLKLIVPKMYNKYRFKGEKIKLIKISPGSYIKQDFNLYIGGKVNG